MSQNKESTRPASELNLPVIPPLTTTVDTRAQKLHDQASTSFTFQTPIPNPTITFNPTFPSSEFPISYHQAVPNAESHPSAPIPSVYPATNFLTRGIAHAIGGESREKENKKLSALEKRLRAIEGLNTYGSIDVSSLRLVPDVVVPPKFKVPEFDKYSGNSDPRIHLATYIAKMFALTEDDRLLVQFFHKSLTEAALHWCIQLDKSILRSWKDLVNAFFKQYKFNYNVAPIMRDLQNLVQRKRESFKEYAQRWREKAAEVYPPVTDSELCSLFIETLKALYFNLMIGNTSNSFSDIIQTGERIEANLRLGRLQEVVGESSMKKLTNFEKRKEGDVQFISKQIHLPPQNNFHPYTSAQSPYPPAQIPMVANVLPPFSNYHRSQYPPQAAYNPRPSDQNTPFRPPAPQPGPRPSRNSDPPLPLPLSEIYSYLKTCSKNDFFSVPTTSTPPAPPLTIIRTPPQLPVTNTHVVPWNYNFQVYT
ncbi:uncharacterized protein LOC131174625 [Hevea brasiliensis]|uniref:uncharacterized protein LOC131174625 n=1 Tax=Hevea brasiliensis TaxID=3981 RepID=UPI0025EE272B|nr:uncharacterized protein LOC131174625 [Hevea brasiliensis]